MSTVTQTAQAFCRARQEYHQAFRDYFDSQVERLDANIESIDNLQENLKDHGYEIGTIPYILQLNKRDLDNIMPVDVMLKHLQIKDEPVIEAVATDGVGVFQSLKTVSKMVLVDLRKRLM